MSDEVLRNDAISRLGDAAFNAVLAVIIVKSIAVALIDVPWVFGQPGIYLPDGWEAAGIAIVSIIGGLYAWFKPARKAEEAKKEEAPAQEKK